MGAGLISGACHAQRIGKALLTCLPYVCSFKHRYPFQTGNTLFFTLLGP